MKRLNFHLTSVGIATLAFLAAPSAAAALQSVRPVIFVYIAENMSVTQDRPSFADSIVITELSRRGYKTVSPAKMSNLAELLPRDVASVWNADKRAALYNLTRADLLWLATVSYEPDSENNGAAVTGKAAFSARAIGLATGETLWSMQVKASPFLGATLQGATRQALAEVLPRMVENFDRDPKVKSWTPAATPRTILPTLPLMSRTPSGLPPGATPPPLRPGLSPESESARQPYTGVIIDAEHLPVVPSYRSGVYSEKGQPIIRPESSRMTWAESAAAARQQAGPNPLRIRAYSASPNGIVLRESDARRLQQEKGVLERGRTTIIVQPPRR